MVCRNIKAKNNQQFLQTVDNFGAKSLSNAEKKLMNGNLLVMNDTKKINLQLKKLKMLKKILWINIKMSSKK